MTQAQPLTPRSTALVPALLGVGGILVAIAGVDTLSLLATAQWGETDWRLGFMSQVIDRGLIPLMGLALLCLGCWISTYQRQPLNLKPIIMRVVTLLSLALALVYLVVAPFYFSENRLASAQTTQTLNEQVSQAELQLENRLNQELGLISNLMDDETQLQQQLQGQALNAAQQSQLDNIMAQLQQFKDDPEALQQRTAEARNTALAQLRRQQGQALQQSRYRFLRDALRLSLSSFVLAIGYLTLAIVGLQQRQN